MAYTTISIKHVICPLWNTEILLQGHYLLSEEKDIPMKQSSCPLLVPLSKIYGCQNRKGIKNMNFSNFVM